MRDRKAQPGISLSTVPFCVRAGHTWRGGQPVPASYQIDKARRLVISTASGFLTAADILVHQRKLQVDPSFDPDCSQIVDCCGVTGIDLSPDDIRAVTSATIFSPHSRRAVVVASDEQFGFARMFKMMREAQGEYGIRVFRDRTEALRWALPDENAFSKSA
jgi:hypothetical protein